MNHYKLDTFVVVCGVFLVTMATALLFRALENEELRLLSLLRKRHREAHSLYVPFFGQVEYKDFTAPVEIGSDLRHLVRNVLTLRDMASEPSVWTICLDLLKGVLRKEVLLSWQVGMAVGLLLLVALIKILLRCVRARRCKDPVMAKSKEKKMGSGKKNASSPTAPVSVKDDKEAVQSGKKNRKAPAQSREVPALCDEAQEVKSEVVTDDVAEEVKFEVVTDDVAEEVKSGNDVVRKKKARTRRKNRAPAEAGKGVKSEVVTDDVAQEVKSEVVTDDVAQEVKFEVVTDDVAQEVKSGNDVVRKKKARTRRKNRAPAQAGKEVKSEVVTDDVAQEVKFEVVTDDVAQEVKSGNDVVRKKKARTRRKNRAPAQAGKEVKSEVVTDDVAQEVKSEVVTDDVAQEVKSGNDVVRKKARTRRKNRAPAEAGKEVTSEVVTDDVAEEVKSEVVTDDVAQEVKSGNDVVRKKKARTRRKNRAPAQAGKEVKSEVVTDDVAEEVKFEVVTDDVAEEVKSGNDVVRKKKARTRRKNRAPDVSQKVKSGNDVVRKKKARTRRKNRAPAQAGKEVESEVVTDDVAQEVKFEVVTDDVAEEVKSGNDVVHKKKARTRRKNRAPAEAGKEVKSEVVTDGVAEEVKFEVVTDDVAREVKSGNDVVRKKKARTRRKNRAPAEAGKEVKSEVVTDDVAEEVKSEVVTDDVAQEVKSGNDVVRKKKARTRRKNRAPDVSQKVKSEVVTDDVAEEVKSEVVTDDVAQEVKSGNDVVRKKKARTRRKNRAPDVSQKVKSEVVTDDVAEEVKSEVVTDDVAQEVKSGNDVVRKKKARTRRKNRAPDVSQKVKSKVVTDVVAEEVKSEAVVSGDDWAEDTEGFWRLD
ncbi:uncharacterized protein [Panulirus ornatus]|uniref:uncharacterized protein isoform X4 n=1 Tax=Panulirus ornatus TaxID=150431 RepID=UPI003A837AE4